MMMTDARGKLGGQVFSKNRSGAVVRTKVTPVNPQSVSQSEVRNRFGSLSSNWRGLTEPDRQAWNSAAAEFAKTNVFGDQYFPTGKNLYVGINSNLGLVGQPSLDAPSNFEPTGSLTITALDYSITDEEFAVTLAQLGIPVGSFIVYEASKPSSAGKYNFRGGYKVIATAPIGTPLTPEALYNAYNENIGYPSITQKIAVRVKIITPAGNSSTYSSSTTIVRD